MNTTALWLEACALAAAVTLPELAHRAAKTELGLWLLCVGKLLSRPPYTLHYMWACLRIMLYVAPWADSKREIVTALARLFDANPTWGQS